MEALIQDEHGIVHDTTTDETLCGVWWYDQEKLRVRKGWGLPATHAITCLPCATWRTTWLD